MWVLSTQGFARNSINFLIFYLFNSLLVFYLYYYRNLRAFVIYNVFFGLHPIYNVRLSCRRYYPKSQTLILWLIQCFYTLFYKIHWILGVGLFCGCSNWRWPSHEHFFLYFDQLWISVIVFICCQKKHFRWRVGELHLS